MKNSPVKAFKTIPKGFEVTVSSKGPGVSDAAGERTFTCRNLVIAAGGASYPSTGSDGSVLQILRRDLGIAVTDLRPALAPVYVQDYPFAEDRKSVV